MKMNSVLKSCALMVLAFIFAGSASAENLVISLESAGIRAKPDFFAAVEATVPYGTEVQILAKEGAWIKVKHAKTTGWVHQSSFAKAGPILKDIGKGEKAVKDTYKDEIVTAGKGFSRSSASSERDKDSNVKYESVDQIEARKVPAPKIKEFMKEGGLESQVLGK